MELVRATSRLIAEVASELGISESTLGNWITHDRIDRGEREWLTSEDRTVCGSWTRRTPVWGWSGALTEGGLLGERDFDAVSRYRCVDAQKAAGFPVGATCDAAGVSTSA